jgi:pimeloyl-ACP methyl ester carboxylesterase
MAGRVRCPAGRFVREQAGRGRRGRTTGRRSGDLLRTGRARRSGRAVASRRRGLPRPRLPGTTPRHHLRGVQPGSAWPRSHPCRLRSLGYDAIARDTIPFLERVVGGPAALVGHSNGATVALLTALTRPDLVTALVSASGVLHHDAWALGALDLDEETLDGFRAFHAEVSPDGPGAFDALHTELDRMHRTEPTLRRGPRGLPGSGPGHCWRRRGRDPSITWSRCAPGYRRPSSP